MHGAARDNRQLQKGSHWDAVAGRGRKIRALRKLQSWPLNGSASTHGPTRSPSMPYSVVDAERSSNKPPTSDVRAIFVIRVIPLGSLSIRFRTLGTNEREDDGMAVAKVSQCSFPRME